VAGKDIGKSIAWNFWKTHPRNPTVLKVGMSTIT